MPTYVLRELPWAVSAGEPDLTRAVAAHLRLKHSRISQVKVLRRSLDSRKRRAPHWKFTVEFAFDGPIRHPRVAPVIREPEAKAPSSRFPGRNIAIIGSGPAGMAAAWALSAKGYRVRVFEQGSEVGERFRDIRRFMKQALFNPHSNILFGEGGAGTFSDGKLTSRSRTPETLAFLRLLVECGAPESITYDSHPHIGTDQLQFIVKRWREVCIAQGCEFHFNSPVTRLVFENGRVRGLECDGNSRLFDAVVWAAGHSARPLYRDLAARGVAMAPKIFAVGVRVEHPQTLINARQVGDEQIVKLTGAAEYYLTWNDAQRNLSAYSFCMCPGGVVVPCADSADGLFTNGMSYSTRGGRFANSAVVVPVDPSELPQPGEGAASESKGLAGLDYQEDLEKRAFALGGGGFHFPAQTLPAYMQGRIDKNPLPASSFSLPLVPADFNGLFSQKVNLALRSAFEAFEGKIPGFIEQGLIIGPESRTSSPVRILRDPVTLESVSTPGLYPLGEGAGYAGGIVSSGADGLRLAQTWSHCRENSPAVPSAANA